MQQYVSALAESLFKLTQQTAQTDLPAYRQAVAFVCLRTTLLLCFGIYHIDDECVSLARRSASTRLAVPKPHRAGNLILSNLSSPVDVLYIAYR